MLRIWKLKRARARIDKDYEKKMAALRAMEKPGPYEFAEADYDYHDRRKDIDGAIEYVLSQVLIDKANSLDVPKPPYTQKEFWDQDEQDGEVSIWLNVNGRAHLRKLVREEKMQRFDLRYGKFIKIGIPLLGFLVALCGIYLSYVALQNKKAEPKEKPPVTFERLVER
jgi:hypothetical protein